jgi:competence protein ComEC
VGVFGTWETGVGRRPPRALYALGALIAGYIAARHLQVGLSTGWFAAAGLLLVAGAVGRGWVCRGALVAAAACLAAGWFTLRIHEPPRGSLRAFFADGVPPGMVATVEGLVLSPPRVLPPLRDILNPQAPRSARTRFDIGVESLHGEAGVQRLRGRLSVWVGEAMQAGDVVAPSGWRGSAPPEIRAGDRVRITGLFVPITGPLNPGEPDRRLWAAQDDRAGILRLPSLELVEHVHGPQRIWDDVHGGYLSLRGWLNVRAQSLLRGEGDDGPGRGRALLSALILGEQELALREVRGTFTRLGLAHVLCISGFHLAMLAMVAMFILRAGGDLGRLEPMLIAVLLGVYLAVLPFQAPVWRAALMVLGLLIADGLGRRYDRVAVVAWIAILMLLWRPMDLWSIGFQLSFGLVAVLIWLSEPLHQRIWGVQLLGVLRPDPGPLGTLLEWFKRLFTANLLCWGVATPVIAYHTGLVSPLAVLAGVVAVPLVMIVLIGGYGVLLLGVVAPAAAGLARTLLEWLAHATTWGVVVMDSVPGSSLRIPSVSLGLTVAATALALYWFWRGHVRDRVAWLGTVGLVVWIVVELGPGSALPRHVSLRIDALAVGDGTCMLVRSGSEAMLWDCGSLSPGVGQVVVPRAVRALGAASVPVIVVTHPHLDHYNAVLDVAEPLRVRTVIVGERFVDDARRRPNGPEAFLIEGLAERGVEVRAIAAGARLQLGDAELEFISPPAGAAWSNPNDQSLAAMVRPGVRAGGPARRVLLSGDMERQALEQLMHSRPQLRVDVLEAPHHGSARDPAFEFVARLDPAVVVQSTGPSRVDDPRWESVRSGRRWHKTARDGAIWVEIRRNGTIASGTLRGR